MHLITNLTLQFFRVNAAILFFTNWKRLVKPRDKWPFLPGCISLGSPSVWQCQGGHCGLWAGALSLGARREGWLAPPACSREGLLARKPGNHNPVSAPLRPGEGFQVGILLGGRDWASCCPFLLSQLCVSRGTRLSETLAGLSSFPVISADWDAWRSAPCTPAHFSSPGQDALPGAGHTVLSETC